MKNTQLEFQDFINTLKNIIKTKGLKYKDLADLSSIPESTLKKTFAGRDCSMITMLEICKALEIDPKDVFDLTQKKTPEVYRFTDEQQDYFVDDIKSYKFFVRLFRKHKKEDVLADLQINAHQARTYLKELENIGLLERIENNQLKFIPKGAIKIDENSKLHDQIAKEVALSLLEAMPDLKGGSKEKIHEVGSLMVSHENLAGFVDKLNNLFSEFETKAQKEAKYLAPKNLHPITYILAAAKFNSVGK